MTELILIVALIIGVPAALAGWLAYRVGVRHGMGNVVSAMLKEINPALAREKTGEVSKILSSRYSTLTTEGPFQLGRLLSGLGIADGMNLQTRMHAPPKGEIEARMPRDHLNDVAWLADYGLRVWISPDDRFRVGERLSKERAEHLANVIETLERKAADWPNETEEEKERRFSIHEDRMLSMWKAYPARRMVEPLAKPIAPPTMMGFVSSRASPRLFVQPILRARPPAGPRLARSP